VNLTEILTGRPHFIELISVLFSSLDVIFIVYTLISDFGLKFASAIGYIYVMESVQHYKLLRASTTVSSVRHYHGAR